MATRAQHRVWKVLLQHCSAQGHKGLSPASSHGKCHSLLCSWGFAATLTLCIPMFMLLHFFLLQQVQNSRDNLSISITSSCLRWSIYTRQANADILEFKVTGVISALSSTFLRGGRIEDIKRNSFTSGPSTNTFMAESTVAITNHSPAPKIPDTVAWP